MTTTTDRSSMVTVHVTPHWYLISEELLSDWYPALHLAAEPTPMERALTLLRPHLAAVHLYRQEP